MPHSFRAEEGVFRMKLIERMAWGLGGFFTLHIIWYVYYPLGLVKYPLQFFSTSSVISGIVVFLLITFKLFSNSEVSEDD